jgi:hypothetical protein
MRSKVAILGPGKIGEFHAREFSNAGCNVVAILTTSEDTGKEKARRLKESYGIEVTPYCDLEELLKKEQPEIASICTPPEFHSKQVRTCLSYGLNVLCEKPFILDSQYDNYKIAKELFRLAKSKKKILSVNMQWVSILQNIPKQFLQNVKDFSVYMEPASEGVINMINDVIPHMNSLIIKLLGQNPIEDLKFSSINNDYLEFSFNYGKRYISYKARVKKERPRQLKFSINGVEFAKIGKKDESGNYKSQLAYKGRSISIEDPLKISIQRFISAINGDRKLLIDKSDVLYNIKMQDFIIKNYLSICDKK